MVRAPERTATAAGSRLVLSNSGSDSPPPRSSSQCIQRQQPCEFPGTTASYQHAHAHPVSLSAPPYGYAPPAHGTQAGDAPSYYSS